MKFKASDGRFYQDQVVCPRCQFSSFDLNMITCPTDGAVLGETSVEVEL